MHLLLSMELVDRCVDLWLDHGIVGSRVGGGGRVERGVSKDLLLRGLAHLLLLLDLALVHLVLVAGVEVELRSLRVEVDFHGDSSGWFLALFLRVGVGQVLGGELVGSQVGSDLLSGVLLLLFNLLLDGVPDVGENLCVSELGLEHV